MYIIPTKAFTSPLSVVLYLNGNKFLMLATAIPLQCDGYQATAAIFKQVLNEPIKIGIIGAGCSPSTQNAALVSQFYNLTQVYTIINLL